MYWEFREEYAARVEDLKWVKSDRGRGGGLFDLSVDIEEKNDLSGKQIHDITIIKGKFHNWQDEMNDAEPRGPFKNF